MAYMSSLAPLPQNGLDPLPAAEVAASNRRILENFRFSREGRERVYANLPTAESLYAEFPGLAVNAGRIIPQSELGRESVLNGLTYPAESPADLGGPEVVSLNAGSSHDMTTSGNTVIPNGAPTQLQNGLWFSEQNDFSTSSHGMTTSKRPKFGASRSNQSFCKNGPGCPPILPENSASAVSYPAPPGAPNPVGPEPLRLPRGIAGYGPQWGQVEVMPGLVAPRVSSSAWLWILGGAAALVALTARKVRR